MASVTPLSAARTPGVSCAAVPHISAAARCRRLQRAHLPCSNILSSMPQSAHAWVTSSPAQSAQVSAPGPGGETIRRCWPQVLHVPRRRSAVV
jgi:hypothetical protein